MKPSIISLNQLPLYSDFPKKVLETSQFTVRYKTEKEVLREFHLEKWAKLKSYCEEEPTLSLDQVENRYCPLDQTMLGFVNQEFIYAQNRDLLQMQFEAYLEVFRKYKSRSSFWAELGAGYGSKILPLAHHPEFYSCEMFAAEYSENGQEVIRKLAKNMNIPLKVGGCDFRKLEITPGLIPPDAVCFTSFSVHYIPKLDSSFLDYLVSLRPSIVIHFEPIFELLQEDTIHHLLCRKYIEMNDYNTNLLTVLQDAEKQKKINILKVQEKLVGLNAFLPASCVVWEPRV